MNILFGNNLVDTVHALGLLGVSFIIFAESGLFFGFFLPGDSLLFTAGLLSSQGFFNIYVLVPALALAAIAGDSVGYWFGRKVGPSLFTREESFFFRKSHVVKTHAFYEKYGPKAVVLARFVPIVRTFVPIMAGVGEMRYGLFIRYNVIGGLAWSVGLSVAGYGLGRTIPNIDTYLLPVVAGIIFVSFFPILIELVRSRKPKD